MALSKYRSLKQYRPNSIQAYSLAETVFADSRRLVYKKIKDNKYRAYCFRCGKYVDLDLTILRQVRASGLCPNCFNEVDLSTKTEWIKHDYSCLYTGGKYYGYSITAEWRFGRKVKTLSRKMVYYSDDEKQMYGWRRGVVRGIGYKLYEQIPKNDGFSRCRFDYINHFGMVVDNEIFREEDRVVYPSKKEYYKSMFVDGFGIGESRIKSNQRKLIQDGIYNATQVTFILLFNLKSWDELYKYRKYIKNNVGYRYYYGTNVDFIDNYMNRFNVYYLDYLSRNNISLRMFYDYVDQCDQLGRKVDKPKNFREKHAEYSTLIKIHKDEIYADMINHNYEHLKQYGYYGNKVKILPFENFESIIDCGEKLHNCISSYIKDYALERCALFYMLVDGELKVAIEIRSGLLIQAYQDFNEDITTYQKRFINKWLKERGWTDGR